MAAETKTFEWNPAAYANNASFVPLLGVSILSILAPKPSERVFDIGCGDAVLTRKIAEAGAVVIGTDASPDMIAQARIVHPEGEYHVLDGHALATTTWAQGPDTEKFDAVFSNAALHWMKTDPSKVASGIRSILKPAGNGRFVAEFGGFLNCATVHAGLINALSRHGHDGKSVSPWYFPSPDEYRDILEKNGFTEITIRHIPRPTVLPASGLKGWLDTFAMSFIDVLGSDEEREAVKREIVEELRPVLCDFRGNWTLDYWRLRIEAVTV
ncbi:hypothetical protein HK100_004417 [Physocladia obscura]|uniref:Methyltransferase type 11 domain-containing protein n=1 Tax=Physocladia obscura TaxID=109957 RepID=A0AAD5SSQ4_9FUNG|nr:hypothetical protein HK100_004417 [Physocladia obscura]